LNHYQITTPMTSYYEHNKLVKMNRMLDYLAEGDMALVFRGGNAGISDPGYELIVAAIEQGITVCPCPELRQSLRHWPPQACRPTGLRFWLFTHQNSQPAEGIGRSGPG